MDSRSEPRRDGSHNRWIFPRLPTPDESPAVPSGWVANCETESTQWKGCACFDGYDPRIDGRMGSTQQPRRNHHPRDAARLAPRLKMPVSTVSRRLLGPDAPAVAMNLRCDVRRRARWPGFCYTWLCIKPSPTQSSSRERIRIAGRPLPSTLRHIQGADRNLMEQEREENGRTYVR